MIKIDIISGFLGAGKTTLIQKLFKEAFKGEKIVLIENEFGEIGIDGGFLKESGVNIKEINSGCICCSLVGDFASSLREVIETYELVDENDSNYISVSGGKSRGAFVCYLDDGKYKTYNVGNATILKDDGKSRMEKQKYKWGFLTGTKYVIYLNE